MTKLLNKSLSTILIAALIAGSLPVSSFAQKVDAKTAEEFFYKTYFDPSSTPYKMRVEAEAKKTPYQKNTDILNSITSGMYINNTGFKPDYGQEPKNKRNLDERIKASARYLHSTAEIRIQGIHGLYPSRYNYNANEMARLIRTIVENEPSKRTSRVLVLFLTDYKAHEYAYIEALIGLAKISSLGKVDDKEVLDKVLKEDLSYLLKFTSRELLYGSGKEFDTYLRNRIKEALVSLGAAPKQTAEDLAKQAQIRSTVGDVVDKIQLGATIFSLATMAAGGLKSIGGATPKPSPSMTVRPTTSTGSATAYRIGNTPSYNTYGTAALKPSFDTAPATHLRIVNATPAAAPVTVTAPAALATPAPYLEKFHKYHLKTSQKAEPVKAVNDNIKVAPVEKPFDGKPSYIGVPIKEKTPEELDRERAMRIERELNSDYFVPGSFSLFEINSLKIPWQLKAKLTNLLNKKSPSDFTPRGGAEQGSSSNNSDNKKEETAANTAFTFVEKYEKDLQKYYALSETFIEGYYFQRIFPYLDKVTYKPTGDGKSLYRGMFVTTTELKNILKNGLDVNLTTWHYGAKGQGPIISSSLSHQEAASYIFQSKLEKTKEKAIGVVVKLKNGPRHKLFEDPVYNSTNTIYHSYSSIPADEIEAVYIYGPYGTENIGETTKKIEEGRASNEWIKAFDQSPFLR